MSCDLISDLKGCMDSILGIRDDIGATLKPVSRVTRTWSGQAPGDGEATELIEPVKPSPGIKSLDNQVKAIEIGLVKQGDILLQMVPKSQFETITEVDGSSSTRNIERLFDVGGVLYQVIKVTEHRLWWDIQVRRLTDQTRGEAIDG